MSQPLVSLLIPTFNSALTVQETIDSCTSQTYRNVEILIYDEASKDNTREIINRAASRDSRIRIFTSDKNSGPVMAWRKLLHAAQGEYSTFVWADDLIMPKYVETLVAILKQNPKHVVAASNAFAEVLPETVNSGTNLVTGAASRRPLHIFPSVTMKGDEWALGILAGLFPVSQICYLFNTTAAKEVFDHYINFENPYGFDFSRKAYGNDVSFASELALRSGEIVAVGEPLVSCRASPSSMTVNAQRDHRWQYWLQYVWAIRSAWRRCEKLSPRMPALIRVVDDRVSFCETFYSLKKRHWPKEFNPVKMIRALWFLWRHDRRLNSKVSPDTIRRWVESHSRD